MNEPEAGSSRPAWRIHGQVRAVVRGGLGIVIGVAVWWLVAIGNDLQTFVLPSPPDVVRAFGRLPGFLMENTWVTVLEVLIGFGLATLAGLLIGVAIASSRVIEETIYPTLVAFNSIPKLALGPILVMWLGFDRSPKIVMVILLCFFPIVLAVAAGLMSTQGELAELARSLGASWWQAFAKVRFPSALAQIFVGLKVAMPLAVIGAVVGEFLGGDAGLGYVITSFNGVGDTAMAFAAIAMLAAISVVLFYAIVGIERLLLPWVRETTSAR